MEKTTDLQQVTDKLDHIMLYWVHGENHRPVASHWQTLSHNVVLSTPWLSGIRTHNVSWSYGGDIYNYICHVLLKYKRPSWSWSYGSWIFNYLCNQCRPPLALWVRIPLRRGILDATLCDKACQCLFILKVANIRCFILIKCSKQEAKFKKYAIMS
jgi:hypothetical protein